MHSIASFETLYNQAPKTIKEYFETSCEMLDKRFGEGYACQNPDLVGRLAQSMALDLSTGVFRREVQALTAALHEVTASA